MVPIDQNPSRVHQSAWEEEMLIRRISPEYSSAVAIPLKQLCEDATRPLLRTWEGMKNGLPPMVKIMEGKEWHGTTGSQSKVQKLEVIETHGCSNPFRMTHRQPPGAGPKLAADHQ
jgi:hypothetical protein